VAWPNSELRWRDLHGVGLELQGSYGLHCPVQLGATLMWAHYLSGTCIDRDWLGPYKSLEYSRSRCAVSGDAAAASAALTYSMPTAHCTLEPTLCLEGRWYSLCQQDLEQIFVLNLQRCDDQSPALWLSDDQRITAAIHFQPEWSCPGPVAHYDLFWAGPWAQLGLQTYLAESTVLRLAAASGLVKLWSTADWLQRDCFQHPRSFAHNGWLWGIEAILGLQQSINGTNSLNLLCRYRTMSDLHICETVYWVDGYIEQSPLCSFHMGSLQITVSYAYCF